MLDFDLQIDALQLLQDKRAETSFPAWYLDNRYSLGTVIWEIRSSTPDGTHQAH